MSDWQRERLHELFRFEKGDDAWHDGPGWYYTDREYPDEGSCGAFKSLAEAEENALVCIGRRLGDTP